MHVILAAALLQFFAVKRPAAPELSADVTLMVGPPPAMPAEQPEMSHNPEPAAAAAPVSPLSEAPSAESPPPTPAPGPTETAPASPMPPPRLPSAPAATGAAPPPAHPLPPRRATARLPPKAAEATAHPKEAIAASAPSVPAAPAAAAPPVSTSGFAPMAPAVTESATPGWDGMIAAWLAAHRVYPDAARRDGVEGVVTIRFSVAPDGRVTSVGIVGSSGSALLDNAARGIFADAHLTPPRVPQSRTVRIRYRLEQDD